MAIQDSILTGQLKVATQVLANITALQNGALKVNWNTIIKGNRSVLAVQNRFSLGDTSSVTFKSAYACLTAFVGTYGGGVIDPNAQNPGTIINVSGGFTPTFITYTQATLVPDGFGGFYLPLVGGNGLRVVSITINGTGQSGFTPIYTTTPANLYGFANNSAQIIEIGFI